MKMKKILYILSVLAFGLVSCSQEIEIPDSVPADCIVLNVYNSPMTKAITDLSGTEYERQLNRLDCFFYPKGKTGEACVYYQKVEYSTPADRSANIPFYVDESVIEAIFPTQDECDVFVIANLTEGTFVKGQAGTDVPTLSKTVLTLGGERDAVDKPFVMAGLDIATKGEENNASGTIPLHRASAKITVSVSIPAQIVLGSGDSAEVMIPELTDDQGNVTLRTSFHNGVSKTYLRSDYSSLIAATDFIHTGKKGYEFVVETPATESVPAKYLYTCEVPFYTYARAWEKGAEDAAYLTFEMPWTNQEDQTTQTYYYQILINGAGRNFAPNNWYDLTVNVGVIGSTVETEPVLLKDLSYYILDWTTEPESETGDRYEDVDIQKYTYLVVPEHRLVINNASSGVLHFDASHKLGIRMNTASKEVELLPGTTTSEDAFYVFCGGSAPAVTALQITKNDFTIDDAKGTITYNYPIPEDMYSPMYVYVTVWLELDGVEGMSTEESEFKEDLMVVQYPPMYITPSLSTEYSIFVNGRNRFNSNISYNNGKYNLGAANGDSDRGDYMYVITVSQFNEGNGFTYNGEDLPYIVGDPRVRESDTNLNAAGYDMSNNWVKDEIQNNTGNTYYNNGTGRRLEYYYPTSKEGEIYRVVSPKFRISSFYGGYSSACTPEGAAMRCASYQEDGFPAGRWRVPTTAEVAFIVDLQQKEVIQEIFYKNSSGTYNDYFSSTDRVNGAGNIKYGHNVDKASVRCVYDEWYWGSEREAKKNTNWTGGYEFTWGDKKIW